MNYTKHYTDLTIDRLRKRAAQALASIIEDAQRLKKVMENGGVDSRAWEAKTIGSNAQAVVEACSALEVLAEIHKLEVQAEKERQPSAVLEAAIKAIEDEHLADPQNDEDTAYDRAIDDAAGAVRKLMEKDL